MMMGLPSVILPARALSTSLAASTSATTSYPVFIAPFACRIIYAALVNQSTGNIAADDTNFWTVDVNRVHASVRTLIVSKTNKVTGGEAISQRIPWIFTAAFDAAAAQIAAGDEVDFVFTKTASAAALAGTLLMVQYV